MRKEQLIQFLGESTLHIVEAMEKIDANAHGILFIADKSGRLQGTVTDGDIRRWIIRSGKLDVAVADIMNKDPKIVYRGEESQAQDYMKKVQVKALPVWAEFSYMGKAWFPFRPPSLRPEPPVTFSCHVFPSLSHLHDPV